MKILIGNNTYTVPRFKFYYYSLIQKWYKIKEGWRVDLCELIRKDPYPDIKIKTREEMRDWAKNEDKKLEDLLTKK